MLEGIANTDENATRESDLWAGVPLGAYVHVPFCATTCDFCAFYQEQGDRATILRYLENLERELEMVDTAKDASTLFFGGGTPSLLAAKDLDTLCRSVAARFPGPREEWTIEMAPATVKLDKLEVLRDWGVNRISLGAQSFDDELLEQLGRRNGRRQIERAYDLIRSVGFESVNLDLIFAIPGQTPDRLVHDFKRAVELASDHISTYCLTFEEDTALFVQLSEGKLSIDLERERELYLLAWETLRQEGFQQYEVSNFAKPGKACQHNLNTWRMSEWYGIGPSAASQEGGWRYRNGSDLVRWQSDLEKGRRGTAERVAVDRWTALEDSFVFGIRMNDGVSLAALEERFGVELPATIRQLVADLAEASLATLERQQLRLTDEGRLVADAIGSEFVERFVAARSDP